MRQLHFIFVLALSLTGFASAKDSASVKVFSFPCHNPSNKLVGSGVVVKLRSEFLVLTSDHVIYPNSAYSCYQIQQAGVKTDVKFFKRDISFGLGLLKLDSWNKEYLTLNEFLSFDELNKSKSGVAKAFPAGSNTKSVTNGNVQMAMSQRHKIASLEHTIEFSGLNVEFGMSGGPIFDEKTGRFMALASHQIITFKHGQPSAVSSIGKDNSSYANAIFGIRADDIKKWLENDIPVVFEEKIEDVLGTKKQGPSIYIHDLKIKLGKSGADGAGVGGKPLHEDIIENVNDNVATISFENNFVNELNAPFPHLEVIWQRISRQLRIGKRVQIRSFVSNKMLTEKFNLEIFKFDTQAEFLSFLANEDYIPLIEFKGANPLVSEKEKEILKRLLALNTADPSLVKLVKDVQSVFDIVLGQNPEVLQALNLDSITDLNNPGWDTLLDVDGDLAILTLRFLRRLK